MDVAPLCASGYVMIPRNAQWISEWIAEHEQFPNGAHDDQVDTTMDGIINTMICPHFSGELFSNY